MQSTAHREHRIYFSFSIYHCLLSTKAIFRVFYSIPIIPLIAPSGPYSSFYSSKHPAVGFNYFLSETFKCGLILMTSSNSLWLLARNMLLQMPSASWQMSKNSAFAMLTTSLNIIYEQNQTFSKENTVVFKFYWAFCRFILSHVETHGLGRR